MFTATKDKPLATTVTGSLPRPSWFRDNLHGRTFSVAMGDLGFREQYSDAIAAYVVDQWRAGLDIFVDGDFRGDMDVAGRSWFSYAFERMAGMSGAALKPQPFSAGNELLQGHILHEVAETRLPATVDGPVGPGRLDYAAVWKTNQRLSPKPIKLGAPCGQLVEGLVENEHYKDRRDLAMALSEAMNEEFLDLANAGCPVIQLEEPFIHYASEDDTKTGLTPSFYVEAMNREVAGLRDKTEVWVHTCWGSPAAQRVDWRGYSYRPTLEFLDQLDVDVITFETADNGGIEIADIGQAISKDKKVCIGVVSHRTLQIESVDSIVALIDKALEHIEPERLVLSSDCGFGRQGMSRMHAFYKMVAIAQAANVVRKRLGFEETPILAADQALSLL